MSKSKACNEMYTKLNLLYIVSLVCVHQTLYINYSIAVVCHCMEASYGIIKIRQYWALCILLVENVFDIFIFHVPYNTHCKLVPLICKDSAIQIKLYKRFIWCLLMPERVISPFYPL